MNFKAIHKETGKVYEVVSVDILEEDVVKFVCVDTTTNNFVVFSKDDLLYYKKNQLRSN